MPEEDQDDDADDDHLHQQLFLQVVDGSLDQLRAVVGGDELDPWRQRRPDFLQLRLDPLDDVERVLAVAHHDDAADRVARARRGRRRPGGSPARARRDPSSRTWIGRAVRVLADDDLLDVADRSRVSAAAHHVLGAGELDEAAADVVVPLADRIDDLLNRDLVGEERLGLQVHLVLLLEPADRRHLCHARHALQPVAQVPVLEACAVGRGRSSRSCRPARTDRPSPRRWRRARVPCARPPAAPAGSCSGTRGCGCAPSRGPCRPGR